MLLVAVAAGLIRFGEEVAGAGPAADLPGPVDAIVVLTGGSQRIATGLRMLAERRGERLLISGVHPRTGLADIARTVGLSPSALRCCVDLDHAAQDTVGNAEQTVRWARTRGYRSLLVVTSDYHMPRSLMELARKLPGIALVPQAVPTLPEAPLAWLTDPEAVRAVTREYAKFLAARLRLGFREREPAVTAHLH